MSNEDLREPIKLTTILLRGAFLLGRFTSKIYGVKLRMFFDACTINFYTGLLLDKFKHGGDKMSLAYPVYWVGLKYISIGNNFKSGPRLRLEAYDQYLNDSFTPRICIGDNVNINFDCHIGCINEINIGDGVLIASKVLIIDHFHGESSMSDADKAPLDRDLVSRGPINIGANVWIGEGAVIMPGVTIGANCIIGANSVVTRNFDANLVIGGNPAKIIRYL